MKASFVHHRRSPDAGVDAEDVFTARDPLRAHPRALAVDGLQRRYDLISPANSASRPALVLVLHGTLQSAGSVRRWAGYSFDDYAAAGAAAVAYPQAWRREWNGARKAVMVSRQAKTVDDVAFIRAVIDDAAAFADIDRSRVFVIGFSLGGQMAIRLIHEMADAMAGAAVVSANLPAVGNRSWSTDQQRALPVLVIHGTNDPLAPIDGGVVGFHGHFPKGDHLSADATARYFAARNTARSTPARSISAPSPNTAVHRYIYPGASPPVRLDIIADGGHVLHNPSRRPCRRLFGRTVGEVSVAELTAEFFGLATVSADTP
jgi:polyhydroxybutyrate depolymerase